MAIEILQPDAPEEPSPVWEFQATIGGTTYDYRLAWQDRIEAWHLDLVATDESSALYGKKLTTNWAITRHTGRLPEGGLIALLDMEGEGSERPTYDGLGHRWKLVWIPDEDLAGDDDDRPWTITIP